MSTDPKTFITEEQYLEIERRAEFKSEYFHGEMVAMSGGTAAHNLVAANVLGMFYVQLGSRPCARYTSDMRVQISKTGLFTYPDATVVSEEPRFLGSQQDALLNPTLIVEVLSPSTEAYDRGRKFDHYKTIESLKEYVLISADRIHVDLYSRQPNDRWLLTSADSAEENVELQSIGVRLSLSELYAGVRLPL